MSKNTGTHATAKPTLKDFQQKPYTFELVHPEIGPTGATLTVTSSNTNAYILKAMELNVKHHGIEQTVIPVQVQIKDTAELVATAILDWDNEFFGCPFTLQAATDLFEQPENWWIRNIVSEVINKREHFFTKK